MKIIVDENVSFDLVAALRSIGHTVIAIAERELAGMEDEDVFELAAHEHALLITRDHHFTNSMRFPPKDTGGIIFVRRGNLTSDEEVKIVTSFLSTCLKEVYEGKLVTLYKKHFRVRGAQFENTEF